MSLSETSLNVEKVRHQQTKAVFAFFIKPSPERTTSL